MNTKDRNGRTPVRNKISDGWDAQILDNRSWYKLLISTKKHVLTALGCWKSFLSCRNSILKFRNCWKYCVFAVFSVFQTRKSSCCDSIAVPKVSLVAKSSSWAVSQWNLKEIDRMVAKIQFIKVACINSGIPGFVPVNRLRFFFVLASVHSYP